MNPPLLDCRIYVRRASEFLDGELSLRERLLLRAHLRFCKDCRIHLDQLESTVSALRATATRDEPLPEDRRRALLAELARRK